MRLCIVLALVLVLASSAFALEKKAYQMKEDFGTEPVYDGWINYYYYIPCPTYSWFWAYTGWDPGDVVGQRCGIATAAALENDFPVAVGQITRRGQQRPGVVSPARIVCR